MPGQAMDQGRIAMLEKVFERVALQLWKNDAHIKDEIAKIASKLLDNPSVVSGTEDYRRGILLSRHMLWGAIDQAIKDSMLDEE